MWGWLLAIQRDGAGRSKCPPASWYGLERILLVEQQRVCNHTEQGTGTFERAEVTVSPLDAHGGGRTITCSVVGVVRFRSRSCVVCYGIAWP